jgi:cytochrome c biogenesis protein CcmG/thiol:disulfide interchange protein DsbE
MTVSPRQPPPRRKPLVPIVIGAVVLLGIVAVLASRGSNTKDSPSSTGTTTPGSTSASAEYQPVVVAGDPLPDLPANGNNDLAVGMKLPDIRGKTFAGDDLAIVADGTPKVIFFVAHWCPHCQREVPLIVDWIKQSGEPQGVGLYAVATSTTPQRPNYPPSSWLKREGWPVPTIADDQKSTAAGAAGLTGFPFFVVTKGDGTVVARYSGEQTVTQLEQMVAAARSAGGSAP